MLLLMVIAFIIGSIEDAIFIEHLFVFLLSMFVGRTLIKRIDPILYSILMSATSALSGIIIVASMYHEEDFFSWKSFEGYLGVFCSTTVIVAGFIVKTYHN